MNIVTQQANLCVAPKGGENELMFYSLDAHNNSNSSQYISQESSYSNNSDCSGDDTVFICLHMLTNNVCVYSLDEKHFPLLLHCLLTLQPRIVWSYIKIWQVTNWRFLNAIKWNLLFFPPRGSLMMSLLKIKSKQIRESQEKSSCFERCKFCLWFLQLN